MSKKTAHVIVPSTLPAPERLKSVACRVLLKDLDSVVCSRLRQIRAVAPDWQEQDRRLNELRRDAIVTFLRTRKLPRGWHLRDADTLPDQPSLDDVFVAPQYVKDDVVESLARDRRIAADAEHQLYLDAAAAKNKLVVYADPGVIADLEKLRLHDYIGEARRKLGIKELPKSAE